MDKYKDLLGFTNFEIDVPLSYWKTGAAVIPADASKRVRILKKYKDLYDGDYGLDFPRPVQFNWHKLAAVKLSRMVTAHPPEIESDLSDRCIASVKRAIGDLVVDYIRYGTCLPRVQESLGFAEVVSLSPIYFFPANDHDDALLVFNDDSDYIELYLDTLAEDGTAIVEKRVFDNTNGSGHMLGRRVPELEMPPTRVGTPEQWEAINEATLGRNGLIVPIVRSPDTGTWGSSLYPDITSLAIAASEQLTTDSIALQEFGIPNWYGIPEEDVQQKASKGDKTAENLYQQMKEANLKARARRWLDKQLVRILPQGFKDIRVQQANVDVSQSEVYFERLVKLLSAQTSIPTRFLFGASGSSSPTAGVAIQQEYASPRVDMQALITDLTPALKRCLMIAAMLEGKRMDNISIDFGNFFDSFVVDEEGDVTEGGEPGEGESQGQFVQGGQA